MKRNNKTTGAAGEDAAAAYLKKAGYEILARNYVSRAGEIDIVAAGEGYLVFVEVKTRQSDLFGVPAEAVDIFKRRKISQAAAAYIAKMLLYDQPVRFDVIEVCLSSGRLNHIVDAFNSFLRY